MGVVGRFDACALAAEQMMGRPANGLVGIDDQQPGAAQPRRGPGRRCLGWGATVEPAL